MTNAPRPVVWITGAGSGIGSALGREYGANNCVVVLSGRHASPLQHLAREISSHGGTASVLVCDVRDEQSVSAAATEIIQSLGTPDILVNNAGVTVFKAFAETTAQEFDDIIGTNLRGSFLVTKAIINGMAGRGSGVILNIVSFAAKTTYTESSVYAASKAGVAALMEGLRAEVRDKGVKIVNVFPGAVLTPIWPPNVQSRHGSRMLTAEETASMIYTVSRQPASMMVEEIVLRPQAGDINA